MPKKYGYGDEGTVGKSGGPKSLMSPYFAGGSETTQPGITDKHGEPKTHTYESLTKCEGQEAGKAKDFS